MINATPQCYFNGCTYGAVNPQPWIVLGLMGLAVIVVLTRKLSAIPEMAKITEKWALMGIATIFFALTLLQLSAYASTLAWHCAHGKLTQKTTAAYHDLYHGFFDTALRISHEHPSPCKGKLVTDMDISREPGNTTFLFLGYFLYPVDIRINSTTKNSECLIFFRKTGALDGIKDP